MSIQAACTCGAQFAAKPELAGKRVKCPKCGQPFMIPAGPALAVSASPADDPLGLGAAYSQAAAAPMPFPGQPAATAAFPGAANWTNGGAAAQGAQWTNRASTSARKEPEKSRSTSADLPPSGVILGGISLEKLTGIAALCYGAFAIYRIIAVVRVVMFTLGLKGGSGLLLRVFISPSMLLFYLALAVAGGMIAAGIGILQNKKWGLEVGAIAAYAHFALLAVSLLMSIPSLLSGPALLGFFFRGIPLMVGESLGPVLILMLKQKHE